MAAISSRNSVSCTFLSYAVAITLIANLFLSADAIRCHQCNSHLDEDCVALRLNTPRALRDDQYLKDCEGEHKSVAFCRKTTIRIEVTGEHRIVRGCGFINDDLKGRNNTCYTADNEGFLQTICACTEDGCNSAPMMGSSSLSALVMSGFCLAVAALLRRSN